MNDPVRPSSRFGALGALLKRLRDVLRPPRTGPTDDAVAAEIRRVQVGVIRTAFEDSVGTGPADGREPPRDDADASYLYRAGHALVRQDRMTDVETFFERRQDTYVGGIQRRDRGVAPGVELVGLPSRRDEQDAVLSTLDELDAELGRGIVTPDHVLFVTVFGKFCPATEPEMTRSTRPWPTPSADLEAGSGIRVGVVDTGLWTAAVGSGVTPWMTDVYADASDEEHVDPNAIHEYAGHGTFVSGVVKCLAPGTRVEVEGALTHGGAAYESDICQQLHEALVDGDHPQLISISAGTHTRWNMALLGFEMLAAAHGLDDGESTLVVAAAGNDGSTAEFWPAAFPWVVGVGSVDSDGKVSKYSNYGDWVDVYARGSKIVNAFPVGKYKCTEPPNVGQVRTFKGLAQWSGTSFSTPIVTGLLAAQMSATSKNALSARAAVLGAGTSGTDPDGNPIRIVGPLT